MCVLCKMICIIVFVKKKSKSIISLSCNLVYFTGKNTDVGFCFVLVDHNPELYKKVSLITCSTLCTFFFPFNIEILLNKFLQRKSEKAQV